MRDSGPGGDSNLDRMSKSSVPLSIPLLIYQHTGGHDSQGPSRAEATDNSTGASYELISRDSITSIPTISDFTSPKPTAKLPCRFNLPPRNRSFFGREDVLSSLEAALLPKASGRDSPYEPQNLRTFVLCGTGGMGKTQIVAEFALSNLVSYDAVFWLHADETAKLYDGFTRISIDLGLEEASQAKDQVISRDLVKGWLANPVKQVSETSEERQEASWLMIFDNADDPGTISDFWPVDGNGSVLATSRNPDAKTDLYFPNTRGEDLGPLKAQDAATWLLKLVHRVHEHNRQEAVKVARRLDGIPLAITQMAAQMNRRRLSFSNFLEVYEEEESVHDLLHVEKSNPFSLQTYPYTLATVWGLEKLEHGTSLLQVLSLLDPDGTDQTILKKGASEIKLEDYPKSIGSYHTARLDLISSSLVSEDQNDLIVHRVVQDTVRSKMSLDRLRAVFNATVKLVLFAWPIARLYERHKVERWSLCELLFPHVLALQRLCSAYSKTLSAQPSFAHLLNEAGW